MFTSQDGQSLLEAEPGLSGAVGQHMCGGYGRFTVF